MIGSEQAVQAGKVPCEQPTAGPAPLFLQFGGGGGGGGGVQGFSASRLLSASNRGGILSEASEGVVEGLLRSPPGASWTERLPFLSVRG